jgi:hypothetical protein
LIHFFFVFKDGDIEKGAAVFVGFDSVVEADSVLCVSDVVLTVEYFHCFAPYIPVNVGKARLQIIRQPMRTTTPAAAQQNINKL